MPFLQTFSLKGLNIFDLNEKDLVFAQKHLRILSGLYGLLRPLDLMQPYRLEMGTKLKSSKGNNLYDFFEVKALMLIFVQRIKRIHQKFQKFFQI